MGVVQVRERAKLRKMPGQRKRTAVASTSESAEGRTVFVAY